MKEDYNLDEFVKFLQKEMERMENVKYKIELDNILEDNNILHEE